MKLKTSIIILSGCLAIFIFIMLPVVLSIQEKKENIVASYTGSSFLLKDVNNQFINLIFKKVIDYAFFLYLVS